MHTIQAFLCSRSSLGKICRVLVILPQLHPRNSHNNRAEHWNIVLSNWLDFLCMHERGVGPGPDEWGAKRSESKVKLFSSRVSFTIIAHLWSKNASTAYEYMLVMFCVDSGKAESSAAEPSQQNLKTVVESHFWNLDPEMGSGCAPLHHCFCLLSSFSFRSHSALSFRHNSFNVHVCDAGKSKGKSTGMTSMYAGWEKRNRRAARNIKISS